MNFPNQQQINPYFNQFLQSQEYADAKLKCDIFVEEMFKLWYQNKVNNATNEIGNINTNQYNNQANMTPNNGIGGM